MNWWLSERWARGSLYVPCLLSEKILFIFTSGQIEQANGVMNNDSTSSNVMNRILMLAIRMNSQRDEAISLSHFRMFSCTIFASYLATWIMSSTNIARIANENFTDSSLSAFFYFRIIHNWNFQQFWLGFWPYFFDAILFSVYDGKYKKMKKIAALCMAPCKHIYTC